MSDFDRAYRAKRLTHEELISRMKPGQFLVFNTWMGQPHGMMRALAKYGQDINPLYVTTAPASDAGEFLLQPNIRCITGFLGPWERAARRERGSVAYTPTQYTDAYRSVRTNRPADYYFVRVAPMDEG